MEESYNHQQNKYSINKAVRVFKKKVSKLAKVVVGGAMFLSTLNHPYYANGAYVEAENLTVGDTILGLNNSYGIVEAVSFKDTSVTVYNFEVENDHNYFIGEKGYLVHNTCKLIQIEAKFPALGRKLKNQLDAAAITGDARAALTSKIWGSADNGEAFLNKFSGLGDDGIKLLNDFKNVPDDFARIVADAGLVDSWRILDDAVLRKNVNHLTAVDDFIKTKGISPDVLRNELKGLGSHQDEFLKGLEISNKGNTLDLFPKIKMDDLPISQDGSVMGRYVNGVLEVNGNTQVAGKWDYVVKADGEILVGRKHSFMSQGSDVLAAGEVKFSNGKLVDINNLSGHYVPNPGETFNFLRVFKSNGVDVSNATLSIYKGGGDIFSQVPPSATKRVLYE